MELGHFFCSASFELLLASGKKQSGEYGEVGRMADFGGRGVKRRGHACVSKTSKLGTW